VLFIHRLGPLPQCLLGRASVANSLTSASPDHSRHVSARISVGNAAATGITQLQHTPDQPELNEANAIGTTALRARLLPEPHRAEVLKLIREYVQIRVDIVRSGHSLAELRTVVDRSNVIQEALWQQAKAVIVKDNSMVPTGLFIQTLNEMIDDQEMTGGTSQQSAKPDLNT
jgi:hypothetical protein